jgi:4-amino-4-deoxy-L-arabinose transferase-like glycosyltransferase
MISQPPDSEFTVTPHGAARLRKAPILLAGLCLAAMLLSAFWTLTNAVPPAWDQAKYLALTLSYIQTAQAGGLHAFVHAVANSNPEQAPLFSLAMIPMFLLFGPSQASGAMLEVLIWPIVILCTAGIARRLFGGSSTLSVGHERPGRGGQ